MKTKLTAIVITVLSIISCNSTDKTLGSVNEKNREPIELIPQYSWQLITLEGQSIDQSKNEAEQIHFALNRENKTISGYAGCNIFNGSYKVETGGRVTFSQVASTKMDCPNARINEMDVLKVFELTDNYTIQNDMLSLNVGRRAPLAVFKKVEKENLIVEKYWKLKTLEGKEIQMADSQEREIFFTLKNDNTVAGFTGCNSINGEYILEKGNRIRFTNMATTLRACPDIDFNESELLNVFNTADNYSIENDELSLYIGKRAPLAVFEAVYK